MLEALLNETTVRFCRGYLDSAPADCAEQELKLDFPFALKVELSFGFIGA